MAKDMLSVKTVDTVMTDFFMEVTTDLKMKGAIEHNNMIM